MIDVGVWVIGVRGLDHRRERLVSRSEELDTREAAQLTWPQHMAHLASVPWWIRAWAFHTPPPPLAFHTLPPATFPNCFGAHKKRSSVKLMSPVQGHPISIE